MPTSESCINTVNGWATATFSITKLSNVAWLGGRGYSHFDLCIYSQYQQENLGKRGELLVVRFENMAGLPTACGEAGLPRVFATLDAHQTHHSYSMSADWEGNEFCKLTLDGFTAQEPAPIVNRRPTFYLNNVVPGKDVGLLGTGYVTASGPGHVEGAVERALDCGES